MSMILLYALNCVSGFCGHHDSLGSVHNIMFFPSLESQIHVLCVWKWKKGESVRLSVLSDSFETSWTVARQAALSMGFHRQEYWSGLAFLSPGHLPNPGVEPPSLALKIHFTSNISEFRKVFNIEFYQGYLHQQLCKWVCNWSHCLDSFYIPI